MALLNKKQKEETIYSPDEIIKIKDQDAQKVRVLATPIKMSPGDAMGKAKQCGNVFGKALYGKDQITLKLMYLESREVILNLHYHPAPIVKIFHKITGKPAPEMKGQKIRMIVEGTRGGAAYSEDAVQVEEIEIIEGALQKTDYTDDEVVEKAKIAGTRMVRRRIGRIVTGDLHKMRSFYRPYYIAFYGDMSMGNKVRYITIAADGYDVNRTF